MIDRLDEEVEVLGRHLQVFKTVIANEPIGIVKLAQELQYPHHKVRYSLRILEEANLIEPTKQGAITTDQAANFISTFNDDLDASIDKIELMKTNTAQVSRRPRQGKE